MADGGQRGEDGNAKIWISWDQKELFTWKKKTFFVVLEGLSFGDIYQFDIK